MPVAVKLEDFGGKPDADISDALEQAAAAASGKGAVLSKSGPMLVPGENTLQATAEYVDGRKAGKLIVGQPLGKLCREQHRQQQKLRLVWACPDGHDLTRNGRCGSG